MNKKSRTIDTTYMGEDYSLQDEFPDMCSIESQDFLNTPHSSHYFSADRHRTRLELNRQRDAEIQLEETAFGLDNLCYSRPADAIRFENLVTENNNDVILEARRLLESWVESTPSVPPAAELHSEFSHALHDTMERENYYSREERLADISDRQQVRDMVADVVETGFKKSMNEKEPYFQQVKDPKMTMRARQELVRRRRELLQRQREAELEHRLAMKRSAELKKNVSEIVSKVPLESSSSAVLINTPRSRETYKKAILQAPQKGTEEAKKEIKELLQHAEEENEKSKAVILDNLRKISEEQEKEAEMREAARIIAEARQKKLELSRGKADEMFKIKKTRFIRPFFSGWIRLVSNHTKMSETMQITRSFRCLQTSWNHWRISQRRRQHQRDLKIKELELKKEAEQIKKAERQYSMTLMSKTFLALERWCREERHNRLIRWQHEERARKMKEFLQALETKHITETMTRPTSSIQTIQPQTAMENDVSANSSHKICIPFKSKTDGHSISLISTSTDPNSIQACNTPTLSHATKLRTKRTRKDKEILSAMEKREAERQERKKLLAEKMNQKREEEKRKQEEKEKRKEMEMIEAKRLVIEQRKEQERKAREELAQKEARKAEIQRQMQQASMHYEKSIIKYYGLKPWQKMIHINREQSRIADLLQNALLARRVFRCWAETLKQRHERRLKDADTHFARKSKIESLRLWNHALQRKRDLREIAMAFYRNHTLSSTIMAWKRQFTHFSSRRLKYEEQLNQKADILARRLVPKRFIRQWREYVVESKEEKWREYRRKLLRDRVQELLSDSRFEEKLDAFRIGTMEDLVS